MLGVAQISICPEDAKRDRQIETCAFFTNVRRRQINRGLVKGKEECAVVDGGPNPLSRLAHGEIRQADNYHGRGSVRLVPHGSQIDFDIDQVGVDSIDGGGLSTKEHGSVVAQSSVCDLNQNHRVVALRVHGPKVYALKQTERASEEARSPFL